MSRKLVTVRKIDDLQPIEGADVIEKASIDGWNVVVKKGEFEVGDYCIYFEIDSFLPIDDVRYDFLNKSSNIKKMDGKEGIRIKTIKLKGVVSQGLALPFSYFPEIPLISLERLFKEREDLSGMLDVVKYEPPETGSGCNPAGSFPSYIPKTDEERIQSIYKDMKENHKYTWFTPSLKLDGSSVTIAYVNIPQYFIDADDEVDYDEIIVCSRNKALKHDPEAIFWKGVERDNLPTNLHKWGRETGRQIALQAELVGPGIQSNREKFNEYRVFGFRGIDIDKQEFMDTEEFASICEKVGMHRTKFFEPVQPFIEYDTIEDLLEAAEGESFNHSNREGLVYECELWGNRLSFKTISNKFLLKHGE